MAIKIAFQPTNWSRYLTVTKTNLLTADDTNQKEGMNGGVSELEL